jgi:hypothetical protein
MEAKVDIRKLQLLNDRINQTIDALNQVRLSVHGLAHSQYQGPMQGQFPGVGVGLGMGVPFGGIGVGVQGFGPMAAQTMGGWGQFPQQGLGGWGQFPQPGFSHTSGVEHLDPTRQIYAHWLMQQAMQPQMDPYYSMRVQQTFPFASYPMSPLG